jgi:hypothetical protein
LFLWTNRFPAPHLEGYEELIQDPHKLVDEVRGRVEHVEALLRRGTPLPCRGDRCCHCFLSSLCDHLHDYSDRLESGAFEEVLVDLRFGRALHGIPQRLGERVRRSRVLARRLADAGMLAPGRLPGEGATLWLDDAEGLDSLRRERLEVAGLPVERVASESPSVLDAALSLGVAEVEVAPSLATEAWLRDRRAGSRVVARPPPRESSRECRATDLAPRRLSALLESAEVEVEDLPPCLAGRKAVRWTAPSLEPETVGGASGPVDVELLVSRFAASRYRAKSLRCESCSEGPDCRGWHLQRVRAFGLASLEPT